MFCFCQIHSFEILVHVHVYRAHGYICSFVNNVLTLVFLLHVVNFVKKIITFSLLFIMHIDLPRSRAPFIVSSAVEAMIVLILLILNNEFSTKDLYF